MPSSRQYRRELGIGDGSPQDFDNSRLRKRIDADLHRRNGHEQHGTLRRNPVQNASDIEPVERVRKLANQHDVEPLRRRATCGNRFIRAFEPDRLISKRGQHLLTAQQTFPFAFDHQHRLTAAERRPDRTDRRRAVHCRCRQPRLESAPAPGTAPYVHRSLMVANDLLHGCKTQSGSRRARREERLEQSPRYAFVESASSVVDREAHVATWRKLSVAQRGEGRSKILLLRGDANAPLTVHRLRRLLQRLRMTCCSCAGSPNTAMSAGTSAIRSSTPSGSVARSSDAASLNRTRTLVGRTRTSRRRPNVRMWSTRSRPRSAARLISSICWAGLLPGATSGSAISE